MFGVSAAVLPEKQGGAEFTGEDEDLLVLFTSQAALAIRNARPDQGVADAHNRSLTR